MAQWILRQSSTPAVPVQFPILTPINIIQEISTHGKIFHVELKLAIHVVKTLKKYFIYMVLIIVTNKQTRNEEREWNLFRE